MSFYNKTKNPFPFYPLQGEVWTNIKPLWHRTNCKGCCYAHKIGLGTYYFQLQLNNSINDADDVEAVNLRNVSDNEIVNDVDINFNVYLDSQSNKHLVISLLTDNDLVGSDYYLSVETVLGNYYSEVFCVVSSLAKLITIEWASSKSRVGSLIYPESFKHSINIEAVITPTESEIEEDTESDGFGNEIATLQVLKQGHTLSFVVPNFIAQALTALPLHDKVNFINRAIGEGTTELEKKNKYITVRSTPEEDNCNSLVEINYTDELIINAGCDEAIIDIESFAVDLLWLDTLTSEDRECEAPCSIITIIILTEGQLENIAFRERQYSTDGGETWITFEFTIPQQSQLLPEPGVYLQRVRVVHTSGFVFFSNILKTTVS